MIGKIRAQVAKGRAICGLSGGVDSAVAAVLIHEAIGDQLTCVFVDHGLMREGEAEEVVGLFRDHYNIPLVHVDASEQFLGALEGVDDPEKKRKTIGKNFIDVFEAEAKKIGGAQFLAQGTLYPDVIESVSFTGGPSVTSKSHHNVGGLPERMNMKLVEPLRELFKDEVRALGRELGLPPAFVGRHPFPRPRLALRIPVAFLTQPSLWRADLDSTESRLLWFGGLGDFQSRQVDEYYSPAALAEAMAAFNAELLSVCGAHALSCFDLAKRIPRTTTYFFDDVHFTEHGAAAVGEAVGAWMPPTAPPIPRAH